MPATSPLFPPELAAVPHRDALLAAIDGPFAAACRGLGLDAEPKALLAELYLPLAALLDRQAATAGKTLVVGLAGGQGAGKTTVCTLLECALTHGFARRVARFSIDDLYLTRAEREELGRSTHPLLRTRGVPGTHDTVMGQRLLADLRRAAPGETVWLPVFDKAVDDRRPQRDWRTVSGPIDLVLFEGWCVGARAQQEEELVVPCNALERDEDPDGCWRRYVNDRLATDYAALFARLDLLVMLAVPDFACVTKWRGKQEQRLAEQSGRAGMDAAALQRFVSHYERLTRHMLLTMPACADLVLHLDQQQRVAGVQSGPGWSSA